jgi:hypothetical protein
VPPVGKNQLSESDLDKIVKEVESGFTRAKELVKKTAKGKSTKKG